MSEKHRCKLCGHPGGTKRRTGNLSKADKGHGVQAAKPGCGCDCHRSEP